MANYQWIFDGIGTAIVSLLLGLIFGGISGYKIAVKKNSIQKQIAKGNANQRQELNIDTSDDLNDGEEININLKQMQKAGKNSVQVQIGRINNGN